MEVNLAEKLEKQSTVVVNQSRENQDLKGKSEKKEEEERKKGTFAIVQIEDLQASEAISDDGEVGIGDAGVKGTRNGLSKVQFDQACEPIGHFSEHVGTSTCRELLPFGALQPKPSLADQTEGFLVLLSLHPPQNGTELVVP